MSSTLIQVKKIGEKKSTNRKKSLKYMGKDAKPTPNIPPKERDTKIEQTLDIVLNNLIQEGHLNPAKSYMFKTQAMKEHIGRMCDRVHRRKHGLPEQDPVHPKLIGDQPDEKDNDLELSSSQVLDDPKDGHSPIFKKHGGVKNQDSFTKSVKSTKGSRKRSTSKTRKEESSKKAASGSVKAAKSKATKKKAELDRLDSSILPVDTIDHILMKSPVLTPGAALLRMNEEFIPEKIPITAEVQAYRATVDLRGFTDEHISLELDGRRLIIIAQRGQNEKLKIHARKVVEIVDIPVGINIRNLKIGRGSDGSLLVEEF